MELSYAAKAQDNIGWDNVMRDRIYMHWNQCQSYYIKKITYMNTGLNWASSFIENLLQIGHGQWLYRNGVLQKRVEDVLLQRERVILKTKTRLQMDRGRKVIIPEVKQFFNRLWGNL